LIYKYTKELVLN